MTLLFLSAKACLLAGEVDRSPLNTPTLHVAVIVLLTQMFQMQPEVLPADIISAVS